MMYFEKEHYALGCRSFYLAVLTDRIRSQRSSTSAHQGESLLHLLSCLRFVILHHITFGSIYIQLYVCAIISLVQSDIDSDIPEVYFGSVTFNVV